MKKGIWMISSLILASIIAAGIFTEAARAQGGDQEAAPTELGVVAQGVVNTNSLNVRQGPGTTHSVIGQLNQGTPVGLMAVNGGQDWALIEQPGSGQPGWVSLDFLSTDGGPVTLPVVQGTLPNIEASGQTAQINLSPAATGQSPAGAPPVPPSSVSSGLLPPLPPPLNAMRAQIVSAPAPAQAAPMFFGAGNLDVEPILIAAVGPYQDNPKLVECRGCGALQWNLLPELPCLGL